MKDMFIYIKPEYLSSLLLCFSLQNITENSRTFAKTPGRINKREFCASDSILIFIKRKTKSYSKWRYTYPKPLDSSLWWKTDPSFSLVLKRLLFEILVRFFFVLTFLIIINCTCFFQIGWNFSKLCWTCPNW